MSDHLLVVLTNPMPGKEDAYNDWYSNIHIKEIVQIPGFKSAQRFKLADAQMGEPGPHQYLAIYEMDGDVGPAVEALVKARPDLTQTEAMNRSNLLSQVFSAITDKVTA